MLTLKKFNNKKIIRAARIKGGELDGVELNVDVEPETQSLTSSYNKNKQSDFFELEPEQVKSGSSIKYVWNGPFRNCIYICASSGSGKSYLTGDLIKSWRKRWCNNDNGSDRKGYKFNGRVFLISPKDYDAPLDNQQVFRIRIDEDNFLNEDTKLGLKEFENSLVIFDDCESLDRNYARACQDLLNKILTLGRSYHISCINIVHQITNFRESRIPIIESDTVIIFPKSGLRHQYNRFLKVYCGYSKDEAETILNLPVKRFLIIHKSYPRYFMSDNFIYSNDYIYKLTKDAKLRAIEEKESARQRARRKKYD